MGNGIGLGRDDNAFAPHRVENCAFNHCDISAALQRDSAPGHW